MILLSLDNVLVSVTEILVCAGKKSMCLATKGRLQGWADKLMLCALGFLGISVSFFFINLARCFCLGGLRTTVECKCRKGLRVISYQVTQKVKADFEPSHTSETLMAFTLC